MSILSTPISGNPPPDKEVKLTRKSEYIKNLSRSTYNRLLEVQREGINTLWNDSSCTPQEIIDKLGTDSLKIFEFHAKLTSFILDLGTIDGITPNIALPKFNFTVDDGKITVLDTPFGS